MRERESVRIRVLFVDRESEREREREWHVARSLGWIIRTSCERHKSQKPKRRVFQKIIVLKKVNF